MRLDKQNVKKWLSTDVTDVLVRLAIACQVFMDRVTEEDLAGAGQEQNPAAAAAA